MTLQLKLPVTINRASDALTGVDITAGDGWSLLASLQRGAFAVVDPPYWEPDSINRAMRYTAARLDEYTMAGFFSRIRQCVMPGWAGQQVRYMVFNRSSPEFVQGMEDLGFQVHALKARTIGGLTERKAVEEVVALNFEPDAGATLRAHLTHPDPERLLPASEGGPAASGQSAAHRVAREASGRVSPATGDPSMMRSEPAGRIADPAAASAGRDRPAASYETLAPQAALDTLRALPVQRRTAADLLRALYPPAATQSEANAARANVNALKSFDVFLQSRRGLEYALSNFSEFAATLHAYFEQLPPGTKGKSRRNSVKELGQLCFPELPSLSAFREAVQHSAWDQLSAQDRQRQLAAAHQDEASARAAAGRAAWERISTAHQVHMWTVCYHFDEHLARKNMHISTLLRDPATAAVNFIHEKQELLKSKPNDNTLKGMLRLWRQAAFPLELDEDLPKALKAALSTEATRVSVGRIVPDVAEYACVKGLTREDFYNKAREDRLDAEHHFRAELTAWTDSTSSTRILLANI